jgi:type IV fimbrial biogenesis protein FimT
MNANKGFTLIELLIVVAIISMTMAIGLPSFQSIIASSRLTSAANAMVSALQLARTEALRQQKSVVVRKKNTKWEDGWNVFVDLNDNNTQEVNEKTIVNFDALSPNVTVFSSKYKNYTNYDESGRVNTNGTFSFCSANDFRSVVITNTGRVHVESTSSTPSSTYAADCK